MSISSRAAGVEGTAVGGGVESVWGAKEGELVELDLLDVDEKERGEEEEEEEEIERRGMVVKWEE